MARGSLNGFDLSNAVIPVNEIRSGGPPRDGIPSIDHPKFIAPESVDYMQDADEVVSVTIDEETRAYDTSDVDSTWLNQFMKDHDLKVEDLSVGE